MIGLIEKFYLGNRFIGFELKIFNFRLRIIRPISYKYEIRIALYKGDSGAI